MKKHGHHLFMWKYATKCEALQVKSTHMQKTESWSVCSFSPTSDLKIEHGGSCDTWSGRLKIWLWTNCELRAAWWILFCFRLFCIPILSLSVVLILYYNFFCRSNCILFSNRDMMLSEKYVWECKIKYWRVMNVKAGLLVGLLLC